jgi:hypothetical protein
LEVRLIDEEYSLYLEGLIVVRSNDASLWRWLFAQEVPALKSWTGFRIFPQELKTKKRRKGNETF